MALGSLCSFPVKTHLIQEENYGRMVFRQLTLLNHSKKVCLFRQSTKTLYDDCLLSICSVGIVNSHVMRSPSYEVLRGLAGIGKNNVFSKSGFMAC